LKSVVSDSWNLLDTLLTPVRLNVFGLLNSCRLLDTDGIDFLLILFAVDLHRSLPWAPCHATFKDHTWCIEGSNTFQQRPYLYNGRSLAPVKCEHAHKEAVDLSRERKNSWEESRGILNITLESGVAERGRAEGIASGNQVDEDDSERPNVVGSWGVR
jgi:hypothetical protein